VDLLLVAICIGFLWTIRFYMVLILAPIFLYSVGAGRRKSFVYLAIILLLVILVFNFAFMGKEIMGVKIGLQEASERLTGLATGSGSSTGVYRDISTPSGAIAFFPVGMTYLLFSPFPWNMPSSTLAALSYPEIILVYLLWPFIIFGIVLAFKKRPDGVDVVFMYLAITTVLYSLIAGNIGTFYRARTPIMLLLFVFAAEGLVRVFGKKETENEVLDIGRINESGPGLDTVFRM
ncbi:MAG: hypothetical protein JW738_01065, partial [Actinobacteria bacterium]|nr:hypothetical protein [Actinomycetota bacterium]